MKHPSLLHIEDFNYELPNDRIAKYPLEKRDQSKLLIWRSGQYSAQSTKDDTPIRENIYANIADELPSGSLMVFNNTKVVEARLFFQKPSGGVIELFCLEPADHYADITSAMLQKGSVQWKCLVGGAKKWKEGAVQLRVTAGGADEDGGAGGADDGGGVGDVVGDGTANTVLKIDATKVEALPDCFLIEFRWEPAALSFAEVLHLAGDIPLPPYLNRATEAADKDRYQTIYAKHDGSVAAPTAGLHFTDHVFQKLAEKNILKAYVTLHVGAGTFKPVKAAQMKDHEMHAEFIDVSQTAIAQLIQSIDKGIIAVGTTSLRTLESLYWIGVKTLQNPAVEIADMQVSQWEPYVWADSASAQTSAENEVSAESSAINEASAESDAINETFAPADDSIKNKKPLKNIPKEYTPTAALQSLLHWMERNNVERLITKTQIIIAPGYRFQIIRALVTNFHQPQSTLLLLISAIVGEEWKNIYQYALANEYRFLSYGDGSILWVNQ